MDKDFGASWLNVAEVMYANYGLKLKNMGITQVSACIKLHILKAKKIAKKTVPATDKNLASMGLKIG